MPLNLTKPVVCRNGAAARILCTDAHQSAVTNGAERCPVAALIKVNNNQDTIYWYTLGGKFAGSGVAPHVHDLLQAKIKRYKWLIARENGQLFITPEHFSEEEVTAEYSNGKGEVMDKLERTLKEDEE